MISGSTSCKWLFLLPVLLMSTSVLAQQDATASSLAASAPMPATSSAGLGSSDDSTRNQPSTSDEAKPGNAEDLAKAAQYPAASLISFPLQSNAAFALGLFNRTQNVLNIHLVIPIAISENWNLIIRNNLACDLAAERGASSPPCRHSMEE
jgi:hypothetical protein